VPTTKTLIQRLSPPHRAHSYHAVILVWILKRTRFLSRIRTRDFSRLLHENGNSIQPSVHPLFRRSVLFLIRILIASAAFLPTARALNPPPDGGYPGGNTAEGQNALIRLTTGTYNTAVGLFSLRALTEGKFNTAVGAGTLIVNTADQNTATGAGALLSNTNVAG